MVKCRLCSRCCLGFRKDPYWPRLGQLLYLLYTAEMALVTRHGLNLHQYANDTQVYISISARDAEAAVARLTTCLVGIEAWLKASRLQLHPTKTRVMWLGSTQQLAKINILEVPVASTHLKDGT